MCIPPLDEEPSLHFALLAKIAAKLGLSELSMGMSGDFGRAIPFGATYVRVGTAIFGAAALAPRYGITTSVVPRRARRSSLSRSCRANAMQPSVGV